MSSIYAYLRRSYLTEDHLRVRPLKTLPGFNPNAAVDKALVSKHLPPLLIAYLRLGARIAGEPTIDEQFGVSDFLVFMDRDYLVCRDRARYLS